MCRVFLNDLWTDPPCPREGFPFLRLTLLSLESGFPEGQSHLQRLKQQFFFPISFKYSSNARFRKPSSFAGTSSYKSCRRSHPSPPMPHTQPLQGSYPNPMSPRHRVAVVRFPHKYPHIPSAHAPQGEPESTKLRAKQDSKEHLPCFLLSLLQEAKPEPPFLFTYFWSQPLFLLPDMKRVPSHPLLLILLKQQ